MDYTDCVIGIEYDACGSPQVNNFNGANLSFCQWTFMAAPQHAAIRYVVRSFRNTLDRHSIGTDGILAAPGEDVGKLTGPGARLSLPMVTSSP